VTLSLWTMICGWTALAGALLLVARLMLRPDRGGWRRCPGPRAWWRSALRPVWSGGCGYDLTGLPPADGEAVTCPECGRRVSPVEALAPPGLRWVRAGVIALAIGALGWGVPMVKTGEWARYVPTPALALSARADVQSPSMRAEMVRRLRDRELPEWAASTAAAALVRELRDDDRPFNSIRAMQSLEQLGAEAIGPLERALASDDPQQRLLSASVLRQIPQYDPSPRMLDTIVHGLAADARTWDEGTHTPVALQRRGVQYLARLGERAAPAMERGMRSDDESIRFACAVAAGFGRCESLVDMAAPILIDRLADNDIAGDAALAAPALWWLGEAARPWLAAYTDAPDPQQRSAARLILLELDGPATTGPERARRRALNSITSARSEPLAVTIDDLYRLW
jgi:hypothetical protein